MVKSMKKMFLFPLIVVWMCIALTVFKIGNCLRNIGNRMSGYRLDDSIGKAG